MERIVGTVVRGLRAPIFKSGDILEQLIPDLLEKFYRDENIQVGNKDILAITESVVARAQGNYASVDQIAASINQHFNGKTLGILFPMLSRNRFAILLKAMARSQAKKLVIQLSYPADEVGNHLVSIDQIDEAGLNPWSDVFDEKKYRELFGEIKHTYTEVDYVQYYGKIVEKEGKECEFIFANDPRKILKHTKQVIHCDVHSRKRTKRILNDNGGQIIRGLDDLLTKPINGSGYNEEYGLLGSNTSTDEEVKLFPRDSTMIVNKIQQEMKERTGKTIEVMVYGDGAFKDPVGHIWELADPVVSPGYTKGLEGTPSEIKLKYLADNDFKDLSGDALEEAISEAIQMKEQDLVGHEATLGTTPRQLTDLIGSLCDLTSGSGDKGTPIVYIQGYFDNFIN